MAVDKQFLQEVFDKQPGKYLAFSAKLPSGRWVDRFFTSLDSAIRWVEGRPEGSNLYFCPTKLKDKRRVKNNVSPSKFLYSDLDEADPTRFEPELRPTHVWESSPGRYQALWELDEAADPKEIEQHNKGLAYEVGGDKGGWDLTQVLRIPGTRNYKYSPPPTVKTLWIDPIPRAIDVYPSADSDKSRSKRDEEFSALSSESKDLNKALRKYRRRIPRRALRLLLTKYAEQGKRSDVLWYLGHTLIDNGVPDKIAFQLIRASAWNKYRGRSDEIERLSYEIREAKKDRAKETRKLHDEPLRSQLTITSHADLMANLSASPGWLVERMWTRESHGIVAGEPKSFKSTILLDFVVSIASGEPFLGQFEVKESGPVLVVQNENSDWIMQDRLAKITHEKRLTGKMKRSKNGHIFTPPTELPIFYVNQQGFLFSDPDHQEIVESFVDKARPIAVIFDPLYLMFDGDVNSAKDLGPALSWLLYLKQEYSTSIMLVHHWGKNRAAKRGGQRMLGSTTLHGWIESAWYIGVQGTEDEGEDLDTAASSVKLTLEREFRGAGTYPKVDVTIGMGEFGSRKYDLEVEKHQDPGRPKKDRDSVRDDVISVLEKTTRSMSIRAISKELELSRRVISEVIAKLLDEGTISKDGNNVKLSGEIANSGKKKT